MKPRRFTPAGSILWAEPSVEGPSFSKRKRVSGARAKGLQYEERVHRKFLQDFDERYVIGPWIRFQSADDPAGKLRWCQPDSLLFDIPRGIIIIPEIKYNHTELAWWQLRQLYAPVVQFLFPLFEIRICEVCKWFDCKTSFPEEPALAATLCASRAQAFNLHIYRPKAGDP